MLYVIGNNESYEDWGIDYIVESDTSPAETVAQFRSAYAVWHKTYMDFLTKLNSSLPPLKPYPSRPTGIKSKVWDTSDKVVAWKKEANERSAEAGKRQSEWNAANPAPTLKDFLTQAGFITSEHEIIR